MGLVVCLGFGICLLGDVGGLLGGFVCLLGW